MVTYQKLILAACVLACLALVWSRSSGDEEGTASISPDRDAQVLGATSDSLLAVPDGDTGPRAEGFAPPTAEEIVEATASELEVMADVYAEMGTDALLADARALTQRLFDETTETFELRLAQGKYTIIEPGSPNVRPADDRLVRVISRGGVLHHLELPPEEFPEVHAMRMQQSQIAAELKRRGVRW